MTYKIALNFEDGVTRFIDCNATETVADAAYRQGVNVPIDCRDGACGACKCKAESGQYELGFYIDDAMSEEEAKLGYVLTCQMHPKSDCVVNIPASSEVCKIKHATLTATVAEVRQLSASTLSLVLQGEGVGKLAFLPGQYANLTVPGTEQTRAYSFSSMPASRNCFSRAPVAPDPPSASMSRRTFTPSRALVQSTSTNCRSTSPAVHTNVSRCTV